MSPSLETRRRLAALREHPQFEELLRRRPSSVGRVFVHVLTILFLVVFAGVAVFFASLRPGGSFGAVWKLLSLMFVAVGLAGIAWTLWRLVRFTSAPLERLPALVVNKRQDASRLSNDGGRTYYYYVTLEFEDGERRELVARGKLYGSLGSGDVGVAYIKHRDLIDYRRLEIE